MRKTLLILILILLPTVGIAEDIVEYNGNTWRSWNFERKTYFVAGFIGGSAYTIMKNQFSSSVSFDQKKASDLWIETMTPYASAQKQKIYNADDIKLIVYIEGKYMRDSLSDYLIAEISSDQIADGLDILYKDFKNRNILLMDAIYVIKKQIKGSTPEDIERILLYLRSDKKEDKHLRIKDEKGKIIKIISFP